MGKVFKTPQQVLYVCSGTTCKKRGSKELGKLFKKKIKAAGLRDEVEVIKTKCTDRCKFGPVLCLQPQNHWLQDATEEMILQLFKQEVLKQNDESEAPEA